jgi:UDP-glucose 4-epimerase
MNPAPLSPYAAAKLAGEHYCQVFNQVYGLPTIALRYFNIFGPRQDPESLYAAVIPRFITRMLRGESPTINGDGGQSRDFTYVANVVSANLLACAAPKHADGQVMNIACGKAYTLIELVTAINTILGTHIEPTHGPAQVGDVRHSLASIEQARSLIGYTSAVDFQAGLQWTIESLSRRVSNQ